MSRLLTPGTPIPDLTLSAVGGRQVRLRDLLGAGSLVIFFYPRNATPGCTRQACGFRDAYEEFTRAGAAVVGISADDERAHEAFTATHKLPFDLLSDADGTARAGFGVGKFLGLQAGRVTFVIDGSGLVRHVVEAQLQVGKHIAASLRWVHELQAEAAPRARR